MASAEAQKAKDNGNAAFKAGDFPAAIGHYTSAILSDRKDPTFPLNRAAAYLKLGKFQDAERDCTAALQLKPAHVKALYRRAQARIELGKLDSAKQDLRHALKIEPANQAVKDELKRLDLLLQNKPGKRPNAQDVHASPSPSIAPLRRRVPIEIIEPNNIANLDNSLRQPASSATSSDLKPISTRSLSETKSGDINRPSVFQSDSNSSSQANRTSSDDEKSSDNVNIISDRMHAQALDENGRERANVTNHGPARGGVFRASGAHTLYSLTEPTSYINGTPARMQRSALDSSDAILSSPVSLFDFKRSWDSNPPSSRWSLISEIPPRALPSLFKTSLEAPLLVSILETFSLVVSTDNSKSNSDKVREYMEFFTKVPRFSTVVLFLNAQEKELARLLCSTIGPVRGWNV